MGVRERESEHATPIRQQSGSRASLSSPNSSLDSPLCCLIASLCPKPMPMHNGASGKSSRVECQSCLSLLLSCVFCLRSEPYNTPASLDFDHHLCLTHTISTLHAWSVCIPSLGATTYLFLRVNPWRSFTRNRDFLSCIILTASDSLT